MDIIDKGIVKVKLGREVMGLLRRIGATDFEVNVDCPSLVPSRKYRSELCPPVGICQLIPSKEFLAGSIETWILHVGVDSQSVTMPYIYHCSG